MNTSTLIPEWGKEVLIVMVILLIIYIAIMLLFFKSIIKSKKIAPNTGSIEGDQLYFLPAASITLNVTAKVAVARQQDDNSFLDAKIYEFTFEPSSQIQADEDQRYVINYSRSWFASDELRLTTSSSGLLENIALTAEDRIAPIFSQLTDAPKKILGSDKGAALFAPAAGAGAPANITNLPPFVKSFVLSPETLAKSEEVFIWQISLEGVADNDIKLIDASFKITISKPVTNVPAQKNDSVGGLLTRPLRNLEIEIRTNKTQDVNKRVFDRSAEISLNQMVPDRSAILFIPLKRVLFSKSVQNPKFFSGLLTENYISKPSELENLVSIPINVAKAIFSIPAQLLSFKITHTQQETTLADAVQKLSVARLTAEKAKKDSGNNQQKADSETKKSELGMQQSNLSLQKDLLNTQQSLGLTQKQLEKLIAEIDAAKLKQ